MNHFPSSVKAWVVIIISLFFTLGTKADEELNKNGESMPATISRTLKSLDIDTSNPFSSYVSSFDANYGAPVLYKTGGFNLSKLRDIKVLVSAMFLVMAIAIGWTVISGMNEHKSPAEVYLPITYKILMGTVLFAKPAYVYAIGMTISSIALTVGQAILAPITNEQKDFQYTGATFDATRLESIDNSLMSSIQPANGPGASVALGVYDAMAKRANKLNEKANFPTINNENDNKDALGISTSLENAPPTMKMQTIQKNLSQVIGTLARDTEPISFVFNRVSPTGIADKSGKGATSFKYGSPNYIEWQNSSGSTTDASSVVVSIPPLSDFTVTANNIKNEYYDLLDYAEYFTQDELNSYQKESIQKYGQAYAVGVTNYLKASFWDNLKYSGFLSASPPNANADYINNYSEKEKQALTNEIGKLRRWYETTVVRSSGSASTQDDENGFIKKVLSMVLLFGTTLKSLLTYAVIYFYHAVMELYVWIIWLTYPLFFFKGTEKAFKGAVNIFFITAIYPAASILFFMIIDLTIMKCISFGLVQ
jgi:hypothetical protein